jgi:hypothetical protein
MNELHLFENGGLQGVQLSSQCACREPSSRGIGRKDRSYFARLSSPQQQHFDFILCPDTVPLQLVLNFVVA